MRSFAGAGASVNVDRDGDAINLVKAAKTYNPNITVAAVPWIAPAWMKVQEELVNGNAATNYLKVEREGDYAEYLKNVVQAYKNKGVDIDYLSVQNEPHFTPGGYPSMYMSQWTQANVINELGTRLANAGLGSTKILGWEHNWNHTDFATYLVNGWSSAYVAGTAWHCYEGSASNQSVVANANTSKGTFFTECSGTESNNRADTFKDTLWYHSTNYTFPAVRNASKTISFWNLALDQNNGPVQDACLTSPCTGIVTVNDNGTYTRNAGYYILGHFAKFVKPGAVRIGSSDTNSSISNAAFRNPDGSKVVVVHNGGGSNSIKLNVDGQTFGYQLPENSLTTFAWDGSGNWGTIGGVSGGADGGSGGGSGDPGDPADVPGTVGSITGLANKCVDLRSGGSTKANGTAIQLYDCNGTGAQQWVLVSDGSIRYGSKCLDVSAPVGNGSQTQVWECTGKENQRWHRDGNLLKIADTNRCLDLPGGTSANATQLQVWDCFGAGNQQWLF